MTAYRAAKLYMAVVAAVPVVAVRDFLKVFVRQIATTCLFLFASFLMMRSMTTAEFGQYSFNLSAAFLIAGICSLGAQPTIMYTFSRGPLLASLGWSYCIGASVVGVPLSSILILGIYCVVPATNGWSLYAMTLALAISSTTSTVFIARGEAGLFALTEMIAPTIFFLLVVSVRPTSSVEASLLLVIAHISKTLCCLPLIRVRLPIPVSISTLLRNQSVLRYGVAAAISSNLYLAIFRVTPFIFQFSLNKENFGVVLVAWMYLERFQTLTQAVNMSLFRHIGRAAVGYRIVIILSAILACAIAAIGVGCAVLVTQIHSSLPDPHYAAVSWAFLMLTPGFALWTARSVLQSALMAVGGAGEVSKDVSVTCLIFMAMTAFSWQSGTAGFAVFGLLSLTLFVSIGHLAFALGRRMRAL